MEKDTIYNLKLLLAQKQNKLKSLLDEKQELLAQSEDVKSEKDLQKLQSGLKINEAKFKSLDSEVAELLDKIKKMANV